MNKTTSLTQLEAIKLIKDLQQNPRKVTETEKQILGSFVGWGTVYSVFNSDHKWAKEAYAELEELLTPKELAIARQATLFSHYTDPKLIKVIWDGVIGKGFEGGLILEPGCGHGNFMSYQPDSLKKQSTWVGVEYDPIAASIAEMLNPRAMIYNDRFENIDLPTDFDLVIGNVPFGDIPVAHLKYAHLKPNLHCYFLLKGLDLLKEGGLMVAITSTGFLDSKGNKQVREAIAEKAELVGAMRLPNTAHKSYAGTCVTTDIIILRRNKKATKLEQIWTKSAPFAQLKWEAIGLNPAVVEDNKLWDALAKVLREKSLHEVAALPVNGYYVRNPQYILGNFTKDILYGGERMAVAPNERPLDLALEVAFNSMGLVCDTTVTDLATIHFIPPEMQNIPLDYFVQYEELFYQRGEHNLVPVPSKQVELIKHFLAIHDNFLSVVERMKYDDDDFLYEEQKKLLHAYKGFIQKFGYLRDNEKKLKTDPRYYLLNGLEVESEKPYWDLSDIPKSKKVKKHYSPADIFFKRTASPTVEPEMAYTAKDALIYSLNYKGQVDTDYIAWLLDIEEEEAIAQLQAEELIYFDPLEDRWHTAEVYLSGNILRKLDDAIKYSLTTNVAALEKVQPKFILPPCSPQLRADLIIELGGEEKCEIDPQVSIRVRLASQWIPVHIKRKFIGEMINNRYFDGLNYYPALREYQITSSFDHDKFNTLYRKAYQIFDLALNLRTVRICDTISIDGKTKSIFNPKATAAVKAKIQEIEKSFLEWLWTDYHRCLELTKLYNGKYNSEVLRKYDGSHLNLPLMNPDITLRPHQKNAIWRAIQNQTTLFHHFVGAGKTFAMIGTMMEWVRLGLAHKPMMVVENATIGQIAKDFRRMYPTARILVPDSESFKAANRKRFCGAIASQQWDAVIVTYEQFKAIDASPQAYQNFFDQELEALKSLEVDGVKSAERRAMRIEKKLRSHYAEIQEHQDNCIFLEQLGVDALVFDESHKLKNLYYETKLQVAGLPTNNKSGRALDAFIKIQQMLRRGKKVVFATATPIANSLIELWVVLKFLANDSILQPLGLDSVDAFMGIFGNITTGVEITHSSNFKIKERFSSFFNAPEVCKLYYSIADVISSQQLKLKLPEAETIPIELPMNRQQEAYQLYLTARLHRIENRSVQPDVDNHLKVTHEGRLSNLDIRLVLKNGDNFQYSKLNQCALNIYRIWLASKSIKGVQSVFSDISTPKKHEFNCYAYLKAVLIELGIPHKEIAFIHSYSKEQRPALFEKLNNGQIRVILGSTSKMGTGVNMQRLMLASHSIDCPWRPCDVTQRDGRTIRQGNLFPTVFMFRYLTQGVNGFPGFDSYLWQKIQQKQSGPAMIVNDPFGNRVIEDADPFLASAALMKAIATGDERILKREELKQEFSALQLEFDGWYSNVCYQMSKLRGLESRKEDIERFFLPDLEDDLKSLRSLREDFPLEFSGKVYKTKEAIKKYLKEQEIALKKTFKSQQNIAHYGDLTLMVRKEGLRDEMVYYLKGEGLYRVTKQNIVDQKRQYFVNKLLGYQSDNQEELDECVEKIAASPKIETTFPKEKEANSLEAQIKALELELGMAQEVDDNGVPLEAPKVEFESPANIAHKYELKRGKVSGNDITSVLIDDLKEQLLTELPDWMEKIKSSISVVEEYFNHSSESIENGTESNELTGDILQELYSNPWSLLDDDFDDTSEYFEEENDIEEDDLDESEVDPIQALYQDPWSLLEQILE
ncbi:DEAD/DEAH box helicase family protein [Crocosphaera sp.]|uniref:DEAD/DEAH box helicase family protein n=1 Tax=Crocosphaera sp. TaxID=2729996 RepID=UPI00262FA4F8|nr:DEAD/DEAH box helicase family protein [Crocosphaera sp.]MDJ0579656.1 DEAD/DEAH box helicase family protein [Crocosphaera sp.]